jgi:hypothetical protein
MNSINLFQSWFPDKAFSWYAVDPDLKAESFIHHEHKFGMAKNSNFYQKYLMSFYWVAATITSNG